MRFIEYGKENKDVIITLCILLSPRLANPRQRHTSLLARKKTELCANPQE